MRLTVSTNGMGERPHGDVGRTPDAHLVTDIKQIRYAGDPEFKNDRTIAHLDLSPQQAVGLLVSLALNLVDEGVLSGWKIEYPDRKEPNG